jgi:hypothetical protein
MMDREEKLKRLGELQAESFRLEQELTADEAAQTWPPRRYYAAYYATTGFMLGMFGALASLVANVIGSLVWSSFQSKPQHPLRLIQVYLTFPLGEAALAVDSGITLAVGCCLYIATGMLYGILFHLVLTRYTAGTSFGTRLVVVTALSLAVWLVNFYGILSWLQPLLIGGNWIVELVPWWVAAATHLVYGWTMVAVYPLGRFSPYQPPAKRA